MPSTLVHTKRYNTDLAAFGIRKPFALDRGQRVLDELRKDFGDRIRALEPQPISRDDARLVHTAQYIESLRDPQVWHDIFELKPEEYDPRAASKRLNELFDDIALKSGGTLLAAELAVAHGLAANLGGGYHHAFPDHGHGFCALHDIAIAIRHLQKRKLIRNCLIIDTDFHQGDGSAVIFAGDSSVFTLSIHSDEGWPEQKQSSTLDVPIKTNETHLYQSKLESAVKFALEQFSPDLVFYVAGSDPYEKDVLPGTAFIKLSLEQMKQRDRFVIDTIAELKIPLAMVFAGGYGNDVWEVHYWATRRIVERLGLDNRR